MKVYYEDDYGEVVGHPVEMTSPPMPGDVVVIDGEDWRVKMRTFHGADVVVSITQTSGRQVTTESKDEVRLKQMNNAILAINKRQDAVEKHGKSLMEQVSSIRQHVNKSSKQDNKGSNDSR